MLQEEASAAYHHGLPQMSRSQCSIENGRVLLNVRSEESRSPAAGEAAIPTCTTMQADGSCIREIMHRFQGRDICLISM